MRTARAVWRMALVCCSVVLVSCATTPDGYAEDGCGQSRPEPVRATRLSGDRVRLSFTPVASPHAWATLSPEEARAVLAGFHQAFRRVPAPRIQRALATSGAPAEWERQLREEFLARYGPSPLPLPTSLEHSRLFLALQHSPRYMGPGIRDAAEELFRSPAFLASVTLSVVLYLSAWALPEPVFSKAFAAALTVRLAMAVGVLELRNLGLACYRLYQDAEAARTAEELEAVAERFGRAMGGTALRAMVLVASFGVGKSLPKVPEGGLWSLLTPSRYAMPAGLTWQSATSVQMVADGTLVVSGVAAGTAAGSASGGAGSACSDGSVKKDDHQWHHIATNKNDSAEIRGGPWTPRFEALFERAGMTLEDPENLAYLKHHQGPHPEAYHAEVLAKIRGALEHCGTAPQCRAKLVNVLKQLKRDICTPGSHLHQLVTRP